MKKCLLTLLCVFSALVASAQYSGSGSGTASDPYKVFNVVQLAQMANFLNKTDVVFELKSNIDLTEFIEDSYSSQGWAPIGTKTSPFMGTLKGNGYTISGLKINRTTMEYVGLFGYLDNAELDNFTLSLGGSVTGKNYTGALTGYANKSTITKVYVNGQSYNVSSSGNYTAGLAGYLAGGTVTNTRTNVVVSGTKYVGGIVGGCQWGTTISKVTSLKNVSGTQYVGGICGFISSYVGNYELTECVSRGNVSSTGDYTGGIIGYCNDKVNLTNCYHFGNVSGQSHVGGVLGYMYSLPGTYFSTLNKCVSVGSVTGNNEVGGLVGSSAYNVSASDTDTKDVLNIENCYFCGSVTGIQDVGGLVGYKRGGYTWQCYSNADVFGEKHVGGLIGEHTRCQSGTNKVNVASCAIVGGTISGTQTEIGRLIGYDVVSSVGAIGTAYANLVGSKVSVVKGGVIQNITDDSSTGSSTNPALLKLKATYVAKGWDFDNDWTIQETESYPYMSNQAAPPVFESVLASGASSVSGKSVNGGTVYLYSNNSLLGSASCSSGSTWTIQTSPLQSGAELRVYAEAGGWLPSYYNTGRVTFAGQGTEDDPYKIYTDADLQGISASGYYKLMNDVNLSSWISANSSTKGWVSLGASGLESVHIDGDGHTISGLWINSTDDYAGLFGHLTDGSIKNLIVEVASGKQVKGGKYAGILVGHSKNTTIKNVTVKGNATGTLYVGGVTGYSEECTLSSIKYEGSVTATAANARVGGVTGYAYKCTSTALEVTATVSSTVSGVRGGGAFGMTNNGISITKSIVNANVNLTGSDSYAGGLVGYSYCTVSQCVTTGTVRATGANSYAGGIVGLSGSKITDSYSSADVEASLYVGGIAGSCLNTINRCYANGNLSGLLKGGGIVADLDGSRMSEGYIPAVTNCVAANNKITLTDQSSWASRVIGGYRNGAADPDNSNYALKTMQVTLNGATVKKYDDIVEGIAKTQSELQSDAFYRALGWNMDDVWTIAEGTGYPTLRFETPTPTTPDNPSTDPENPSTEPENPSTDPENPSTEPENPASDIEASTDISAMPYVLYFNDVEAKAGDFNLDLNMKCADEDITAFQCDIYLPEGVEWKYTTDKRGKVIYNVPAFNEERTDDSYHTITPIAKNADGSYKIIVYSMQKDNILELDGAIMTLPLSISEEMEAGDYNISVRNIVLTDVNTQQTLIEKVVSKLTIPSYQMGDANGDGMINVTDIVSIISHILGEADSNFIFAAADINGDETINVTDIVGVIDIILNNNPSAARSMKAKAMAMLASAGASENNLQIIPFTVAEGTKSVTAKLNMNNPGDEFTAFQCEVEFPEGIAWASTVDKRGNVKYTAPTFDAEADRTDATYHTVEVGKNAAGNINIFVYSMQKEVILDEEGAVLDLPFTLADNLAPGIYDIKIKNVVMTRTNQTDCKPADYTLSVMVGSPEQPAIVLNGNFTSEAVADFNSVLSANNAISSIDLTEAYNVDATSKINTGNKNALIYVADGMATANTSNLVVGSVCSNLVVTDGYDFMAAKEFTAISADYERSLTAEWGTIMLPYAVSSTSDVQYYALAGVDLENGVLSFDAVSSVEANTPAVFKASGSKLTQNGSNVVVPVSVLQVANATVGGLTLTGTLAKTTLTGLNPESSSKTFYIKDNAFWCGNGTLNIPAFRAYFDAEGVNARVLNIAGEETGIDTVDGVSNDRIYTIDGKFIGTEAKTLPSGLYIVNDKKIIIKN